MSTSKFITNYLFKLIGIEKKIVYAQKGIGENLARSGSSLGGETLGLLLADLGLRSSLKENEYFTVYQPQTLTEGLAFLAAAADFLASLLLAIAA